MRVLITGGAGFIGSHLAEAYLKNGDQVVIIDNLSTGNVRNIAGALQHPRCQLIVDSILNEALIDKVVAGADLIFHMAAAVGVKLIVQQPVRTIETNIAGTEMLLKYANKWRKPIVIASTSEIYGKGSKIPFSEDDDTVLGPTSKSRWSYACSKAIDEFLGLAYFKENALPVICVRLFNTVGPRQTGQYGMVLPSFIQQAIKNKPLTVYGTGKQSRVFASIFDVVRALQSLVKSENSWGQVFNLGGKSEISIYELAELVKSKTASKSEITFMSYDDAYEAGFEDMQRRVPDISKIKNYIGFEPEFDIPQIVDQVIEYFRNDHNLIGAANNQKLYSTAGV